MGAYCVWYIETHTMPETGSFLQTNIYYTPAPWLCYYDVVDKRLKFSGVPELRV